MVLAEAAPEAVPVMVTTYDPAVVPGLVEVLVWLLPPHPERTPAKVMSTMTQSSETKRLRAGSRRSNAAKSAPAKPTVLRSSAAEAAVEETVSVEVTTAVPVTLTEELESAQVTGSLAPAGEVTVQARATVPVNPPEGVMEMVEVFPVAAPGAMAMGPPLLRAMAGVTVMPPVTVTVEVVEMESLPVAASVPVTVIT